MRPTTDASAAPAASSAASQAASMNTQELDSPPAGVPESAGADAGPAAPSDANAGAAASLGAGTDGGGPDASPPVAGPASADAETEQAAEASAEGDAAPEAPVQPGSPGSLAPSASAPVGDNAAGGGSAAVGDAAGTTDLVGPAPEDREDPTTHPLSIARLRSVAYPGSDLVVEQTLEPGSNYHRAVVSYRSEGNKIYALLTVPSGERPPTGWPVVIFNHGYIPPAQYRTTQRYVAYVDAFARNGYIVLKSDYRGHGSSEGVATGGRGTPDYTIDVLNGMASVARHPDADRNRIGMWGHSMGGGITLRSMVVTDTIKAGVIWAGVVASYTDMYNGRRGGSSGSAPAGSGSPRGWRSDLVTRFGSPEENPAAWDAVSPNAFLGEISGPLQLHHGTVDSSVPFAYSQTLQQQMEAAGKPSELLVYEGDDHNISRSLSLALDRSVAFFDRHLKGGG